MIPKRARARHPLRRLAAPTPAAACAALLLSLAGCALHREQDDGAPRAALVDGQPITIAEVDERIRRDMFDAEFGHDARQLYTVRRGTIDELVDELLLRRAAERAGQTPEAWLDAAVRAEPAVRDEDVAALFEQVRTRLSVDATLEDYQDELRAHLEQQRVARAKSKLRDGAEVLLILPPERVVVAPDGPSLGPASAPVTIVEFSDFECPYCARARPVLKQLRERHPDKVRLVYRHLPLDFHPRAAAAATASICADAQDRFWDFHDRLFAAPRALDDAALRGHAQALALDLDRFDRCLADPAVAAKLAADVAAAKAAGATGTPTFFVNGIALTGAQPLDRFEALIADELARLAR